MSTYFHVITQIQMSPTGNIEYMLSEASADHELTEYSKPYGVPMNTDASVTTRLVDYAGEGDELTDLRKELIPPQLSELDLPHAPERMHSKSVSTKAIRIPYKLCKP